MLRQPTTKQPDAGIRHPVAVLPFSPNLLSATKHPPKNLEGLKMCRLRWELPTHQPRPKFQRASSEGGRGETQPCAAATPPRCLWVLKEPKKPTLLFEKTPKIKAQPHGETEAARDRVSSSLKGSVTIVLCRPTRLCFRVPSRI